MPLDARKYAPDCPTCFSRCKQRAGSWTCTKCGTIVARVAVKPRPKGEWKHPDEMPRERLLAKLKSEHSWTPSRYRNADVTTPPEMFPEDG